MFLGLTALDRVNEATIHEIGSVRIINLNIGGERCFICVENILLLLLSKSSLKLHGGAYFSAISSNCIYLMLPFQWKETQLTCFHFNCSPQVRVPKERIAMYREFIIRPNKYKDYLEGLHKVSGPFDIALIKLRESVTLIPGRLVPVGLILKLNTACAGLPRKHQGQGSVWRSARVFSDQRNSIFSIHAN